MGTPDDEYLDDFLPRKTVPPVVGRDGFVERKFCSRGHRNSADAGFCWVCGEFLPVRRSVPFKRVEALLSG